MRPIGASVVAVLVGLALPMLAPPGLPAGSALWDRSAASASELGGVVVNEFAPSSPDWRIHEFVELRNTGDKIVALHGWELVACLSPATWQVAKVFQLGDVIDPGGYLLLAHPDYADFNSPPPDYFYDVEMAEDGGWLLLDPRSGDADGVGLSNGLDCTEKDSAPLCDWADGEVVTRDEQGKDTDHNAADFTCQPRTPGR